jgi:hypothetical protein
MNRPFVAENARELERLRSLVDRLSDDELRRPLGTDWTISVALAHLAFWDQRSLVLVRAWKLNGIKPSPIDIDITNDALLPTWLALPPRAAANLAVSAAEAIDAELEGVSSDFIAEIEKLGDKFRLFRSVHRKLHLDQIEASL